MSALVSRRGFLAVAGVAGGLLASGTRAGAPPKESGLSSEGLLTRRPGFNCGR